MKFFLTIPIRLYQILISPFVGHHCRYIPTCSSYTKEAFHQHGSAKGLYLGTCRILSCHPWSKKDIDDPVPERFAWRDILGYKNPSKETKK